MAIIQGFSVTGDFIAVDTETKAAERGYKGSTYWLLAKDDPTLAAEQMIRETTEFRAKYPEFPSHQSEAWDANFFALAQLISR